MHLKKFKHILNKTNLAGLDSQVKLQLRFDRLIIQEIEVFWLDVKEIGAIWDIEH